MKLYNRVHKIMLLVIMLSHINSIHILTTYLFKIHFITLLPSTFRYPNELFPSGSPTKIVYAYVLCVVHTLHISYSLIWSL